MPNGIDDVRQKLGDEFLPFWEKIKNTATPVPPKLSPTELAASLALRELHPMAMLPNRDTLMSRLTELASYLGPLALDRLARGVTKEFGHPLKTFCEAAKRRVTDREAQFAKEWRQQRLRRRKDDQSKLDNDPRQKIELPGSGNQLLSDFAAKAGLILAKQGFYRKDRVVVVLDSEHSIIVEVTGKALRTKIEKHIIPYVVKDLDVRVPQTISIADAESLLHCDQLINCLPFIRSVNNVRLPSLRAAGNIELLPEGYDPESQVFTLPGGPEVEDMGFDTAKSFLRELFREFCFKEGDFERATSVVLSSMLTLFALNVFPRYSPRPGFLYTANAEGSGKTLLVRLAAIPRIGFTPTGCLPQFEEEIKKAVFASAIAGSPILFFDNIKTHISSGAIESAMTAPCIEGRILGRSQTLSIENIMTLFMTGNGATISPDLRRRMLIVELDLREARAEYRNIERPLGEIEIRELRPAILSALWTLVLTWDKAGRPRPSLSLSGWEGWSHTICGVLEHAGFASPCTRPAVSVSGDLDTEDMERLVEILCANGGQIKFNELVKLCREHGLFIRLLGEEEEEDSQQRTLDPGNRNIFGRILKKFDGRIFQGDVVFHRIPRGGKHSPYFYAEKRDVARNEGPCT